MVSSSFGSGKSDVSVSVDVPIKLGQKKQLATELGVVYVGMAKEDLAKAGYTEHTQKGYYKEDDEEWITFSNWVTEELDDVVTFYLVDGEGEGLEGAKGAV